MSGHKFPGTPWPCGVYMSRHKYQLYPPSAPMYIGSMDSTLSGSRNGLSPIVMWYYIATRSDQ
jgi:histidine decarboxylase